MCFGQYSVNSPTQDKCVGKKSAVYFSTIQVRTDGIWACSWQITTTTAFHKVIIGLSARDRVNHCDTTRELELLIAPVVKVKP